MHKILLISWSKLCPQNVSGDWKSKIMLFRLFISRKICYSQVWSGLRRSKVEKCIIKTFDLLKNLLVTSTIRRWKLNYKGFSTFDLLKNAKNFWSHDLQIVKYYWNFCSPEKNDFLSPDCSFDLLKNVTVDLLKFDLMIISRTVRLAPINMISLVQA